MNPIQQLMIPGSSEAGCLEQTADVCLVLPRILWGGKSVKLVENNGAWNPSYDDEENCTTCIFLRMDWCVGNPIAIPIFIAFYATSAIVAAPLLGVGLALKNFALNRDERASLYSELAVCYLTRDDSTYDDSNRLNLEKHLAEFPKDNKELENLVIN